MAELDAQPPLKWLVRDVLREGSVGMLVGASMSFKTFAALDMALHMAYGLDYMGLRTRAGTVAYVAGEGRINTRVKAWRTHHGISRNTDRFIAYQTHRSLYDKAAMDKIASDLALSQPQVVWLDTLNACFAGMEENSAKDGGLTIDLMRQLSHALGGAAVLTIHHTGRADPRRERGTTALFAGSDVVLLCHRPDPKDLRVELSHLKPKDDAPMPPAWFSMATVHVGFDDEGTAVTSLVPVLSDGPVADLDNPVSKWRDAVLRALRQGDLPTGKLWTQVTGKAGNPTGHFSEYLRELKDAGWINKPDNSPRAQWSLTDWALANLPPSMLPMLPECSQEHSDVVRPAA